MNLLLLLVPRIARWLGFRLDHREILVRFLAHAKKKLSSVMRPDWLLGPSCFIFVGYRMSLPRGVKRPGHVAEHFPSRAKFKNDWDYTSAFPYVFWRVQRRHDPERIFSYVLKIVKFVKHFLRINFGNLFYSLVRRSRGTVSDTRVASSVHGAFKMNSQASPPLPTHTHPCRDLKLRLTLMTTDHTEEQENFSSKFYGRTLGLSTKTIKLFEIVIVV
jgi:hypothetical protein